MKFLRRSQSPPTIPLTAQALADNKAELQRLLQLRKEVIVRLQTAREMGDLSENGAYTAAKFELGNIGRQLRAVRHILDNGYVHQAKTADDVADFGRVVTVKSNDRELTFTLVSEYESNPADQKLSLSSPIGKAVMGKKVGDTVEVRAPAGSSTYTVAKIE